jgi:hypothetical protein
MIFLQDLLFDTPIWLLLVLFIVGVALTISGRTRRQKGLTRTGAALLGLALLLAISSTLGDTPKKKAARRTTQLVHAVEQHDIATVATLLHPDVRLYACDKQDILAGIQKEAIDAYGLTKLRITSLEPQQSDPDVVDVTLSVTVHLTKQWGFDDLPTSWELTWLRTPDGWLLHDIRVKPAGLQGTDEQLKSVLEKPTWK